MDSTIIALRIIHIAAGVLWVGGAALFLLYVRPTLQSLGPNARGVVDELVVRRRLPTYFGAVSTLNVLAGATLYWRDSGGLQLAYVTSPSGLGFTIGAVAALVAWPIGNIALGRAFFTVTSIGLEIEAAGGAPDPGLSARLRAAQARVRLIGVVVLALLTIAVVSMASARYLR